MKSEKNIKNIVESIILVADKPTTTKEIATAIGARSSEIQKIINELEKEYENRGLKIIKKGERFCLSTDPRYSEEISRFLNEELRHDLSDAALETLSIITYRQPVTRTEIENIRGVASDQILRNLLIRGHIAEVGRKESPGRPILYGTTLEFMQYFGFQNENEIPKFDITPPQTQTELVNVDAITNQDEN